MFLAVIFDELNADPLFYLQPHPSNTMTAFAPQKRQLLKSSGLMACALIAREMVSSSAVQAAPINRAVPYEVNGRKFEGQLVYDDTVKTKRPVLFMQPDWKGIDEDTLQTARLIAGKDYVVLMADMYGVGYGSKQKSVQELGASMAAIYKDPAFTVACSAKALESMLSTVKAQDLADTSKVWAAGYCAGGGFLLEHARTGANFKGLVVFHVTNPNPVLAGTENKFKGRVLVVHGSKDPVTTVDKIDALSQELTLSKIDWQVMMFGGAPHSFTDPTNKGYSEQLTRKSYLLMKDFFVEST